MRNKFLLIVLLCSWYFHVQAQKDLGIWAKYIEGHENSFFNNALFDGKDVIVNGIWFLDAKFGNIDLPYHVGSNGLLAKLDTAGNVLWSSTITGDSYDGVYGMALDADKNIVVVGWSSSDIYIEVNGENVYTPEKEWTTRGLVAKFSGETGKLIWFKTFTPDEQYMSVNGSRVAVDKHNNIYISGYYNSSFMFDDLSFHYGQEGWGSIPFIIKMDKDGKAVWGQTFNYISGGDYNGNINPRSLAINDDKLYFAFEYSKPLIINNDTLPHSGWYDWVGIVALSLNSGVALHHTSFGSPEGQGIDQIKIDKENQLVAAGYFTCGTGFRIENTELNGIGQYNAYLAKFDPDLKPVWVKSLESESSVYIFHLNIGANNHYYIGGGYDSFTPVKYNNKNIIDSSAIPTAAMFEAVLDNSGEYITSIALSGITPYSMLNYRNAVLISDSKILAIGNIQDSVQLTPEIKLYSDHGMGFIMKWQLPTIQTSALIIPPDNEIGYYPNPSKGLIHLPANYASSRVEIYTPQGKLVKVYEHIKPGEQISIGNLDNNLYIIRTYTPKGVFTDKVLLLH